MSYIRPENRDTRYALWHVRYDVRVPYIRTLDIEDLEENGLPTSGDPHHDHAMQWEPKLISIPIHRMVEYWLKGVNVSLVRRTDAPDIYKAIAAHLFAWKEYIENSFHTVEPPTDDLLALDEFATVIYDHAKLTYSKSFVAKHLKINTSTAMGRRAMLDAMSRSDERAEQRRAQPTPEFNNINHFEATPLYHRQKEHAFVDYSGKVEPVSAPNRNKLSDFFKKERNQ